jgi:hypothetical protein
MAIASRLGNLISVVILSVIYLVIFVPVGLIMQRRGRAPFFSWQGAPPANLEGWHAKSLTVERASGGKKRRSLIGLGFAAFGYFGRRKAYVYLPALVILVVIGMLMFFAQTSALAPFIYTLF